MRAIGRAGLVLLLVAACRGGGSSSSTSPSDASVSFDAGADVDASTPLEPTDPAPLATSPGKDEDPSLLRAADGTYYLAWFSDRSGNEELYLKSSRDGRTWSPDRAITSDPAHDFYPSLTQSKDGRFHLVWWRGELGDAGIVGSIWYMRSDDAVAWTAPRALTQPTSFAWAPTIVERTPGELVVAYASDSAGDMDVYLLRSTNGGDLWALAPTRVTDSSRADDLPSLVVRADGTLLLAWERYDLGHAPLDAAFSEPSSEIVYATSLDGTGWSPTVALTDDGAQPVVDVMPSLYPSDDRSGWSLAWTSTRAAGAAQGDIFSMPLTAGPATASNVRALTSGAGRDYSARLAPTSVPGLYLMAWVSDGGGANLDIYARFVRP